MKVYKITPVGFASNCYLLTEDGKTAVAIDPAQPRIAEEAEKRGLQIKYVLLTHGHFDHIGGCAKLSSVGAKIGCAEAEQPLVLGKNNLSEQFGVPIEPFGIDFTFRDGDTLSLCGIQLSVIATPGHTASGVCYRVGNALFTGDTLFRDSVGRTDLPTGNGADLVVSVKKLYALGGDMTIYPGHGEDTTLGYERNFNGYIKA